MAFKESLVNPNQFRSLIQFVAVVAAALLNAPKCLRANIPTPSLEVVGYTGEQAPGLPAGTTYQYLTTVPAINDAGIVVYGSEPASSSGTTSIWVENQGSESLLYRTGAQAPAHPSGDKLVYFPAAFGGATSSFIVNDSGSLAVAGVFNSSVTENGVATGIWSNQSGTLTTIALQGTQPPGYLGWKFNPMPAPTGQPSGVWFNDEGDVAFLGEIVAGSNYSIGIWSTTGGSLHVVATDGTPAPGTGSGVNFYNNGSPTMPALNPSGQVAFFGDLTGTGIVHATNDTGLWAQHNGTLALVARAGGQAPDCRQERRFPSSPTVITTTHRASTPQARSRLTRCSGQITTLEFGQGSQRPWNWSPSRESRRRNTSGNGLRRSADQHLSDASHQSRRCRRV